MLAKYAIGTEYTNRRGQRCRVIDVWRTYNAAGDMVKLRYVTEHKFCGQMVRDTDVVETTISIGIIRGS